MRTIRLLLSFFLFVSLASAAQIRVQTDKPGAAISPTLYGIFFEDINFGADGGLYPELVKNRSFEFPNPLMGWSKTGGSCSILTTDPVTAPSPHYLRLESGTAVSNEGFRGMGVRQGAAYDFFAQIRGTAALRVELVAGDGRVLASAKLDGITLKWRQYSATLRPTATEAKARLNLIVEGRGTLDLDMVSLFPQATFKNRQNGLRADLAQLLADLKPGFVRFPGGCIVEGHTLDNRYQWKTTIGRLEERKLILNRWNDEFKNRAAPDYFQSFGLGFFEYFQLCEDIGAEPLPILNCGMACQFNSKELAPLDKLDPYIQDALDLIEFANGPATSPWGAKRTAMGHAAPFNMKFLGVGNEQWGQEYIDRYAPFAKALKAKHPEIKLVAAAGPSPGDARFKFLWSKLRELDADIVDEHSYASPKWFYDSATRYDKYPRTGPKVCMGEYAAHTKDRRNNWESALAEAAFMTGLERNADVVAMSAYAPLSAHVDAWQWNPNLIWFDNLRVVGTANYQVQKLFSANRGDVVLPTAVNGTNLFAVASADRKTGEVILKVVNAGEAAEVELNINGVTGPARTIVLASDKLTDENTLNAPDRITPKEQVVANATPNFRHTFPARSVTVLRLKTGAGR